MALVDGWHLGLNSSPLSGCSSEGSLQVPLVVDALEPGREGIEVPSKAVAVTYLV